MVGLCTLLLAPSAATGQNQTQSACCILSGTVRDKDGAVLASVKITARGPLKELSTLSNTHGQYSFTLGTGRYVIVAQRMGYKPGTDTIDVVDGGQNRLDILMNNNAITLQQQVVTASGSISSLRDAPASVSVVSREDLEKKPVRDIVDIIGSVEGVAISKSSNQRQIQIRGLGSGYTMILVDGKRVNSQAAMFRGNDFDSGWIPTDDIERIEVVRGPMSSLYGSDAVGGVINIITRKPRHNWSGFFTGETMRQSNRDAGDSYNTNFAVGGPLIDNVLNAKFAGSYNRRMGDGAVNKVSTFTGYEGQKNGFVTASFNWTPNVKNDALLDLDYSDRNHAGFTMKREAVSLVHKGSWSYGTSEVRGSYDRIRNLVGNVSGQKNPNKAVNTNFGGKYVLPWLSARQTISVGGETRMDRLRDPSNLVGLPGSTGTTDPVTSVTQHALFVENEIRVFENLLITIGDRYDRHENFGGNHSPRAYVVYHPLKMLTVKGGIARAFKAPGLLQNSPSWGSVSCGSATTGCYIVGSTLLKPETGNSKEFGARIDSERWSVGLTWFRNDLKDMIEINNRTRDTVVAKTYPNYVGMLPDGRPIFRYENVAKARTQGVEATARLEAHENVQITANYTNLDAKNLSGPTPLQLTYRPRHNANVSVDWQALEALNLTLASIFTGKQYISVPANGQNVLHQGGYNTFDLSAGYSVNRMINIRAGMLNILNKKVEREVASGFNEEGSRVFFALTTRF